MNRKQQRKNSAGLHDIFQHLQVENNYVSKYQINYINRYTTTYTTNIGMKTWKNCAIFSRIIFLF